MYPINYLINLYFKSNPIYYQGHQAKYLHVKLKRKMLEEHVSVRLTTWTINQFHMLNRIEGKLCPSRGNVMDPVSHLRIGHTQHSFLGHKVKIVPFTFLKI
jgi:hypothetical protein